MLGPCLVLVVALLVAAPAASAAGRAPGPLLYVGDSLGVGTFPHLRSLLPRTSLTGDNRVGRTSSEGFSVLRRTMRRDHRVVVFDVGTNDWSAAALSANLRRAHAWVAGRLLVVLTVNKPGAEPLNRVIRAFARARSRVLLIDWNAAARSERLLGGDGIHASGAGYARRAALIASSLRAWR
jgi:hypothetical protein